MIQDSQEFDKHAFAEETGGSKMRRKLVYLFSLLIIVFLSMLSFGAAEAARVAVIPIQIDGNQVKRAADFESYYWDVIIEKFQYPDYELMDDEKVSALIPEKGLTSFDQATLAGIVDKADADIVIAMRLDIIKERPLNFRLEPMVECIMEGEFGSYNRFTGKYFKNKLNYKREIEEVLTLRNDWQQQVFASELKRYINRTLANRKAKKK